jgi:2-polyprenyl-3-methyl-5-hydroxy-6-metoxy-1,4-benzoquinol methylase
MTTARPPTSGSAGNPGYEAFHAPRLAFLLDLLRQRVRVAGARVLDVGPSRLTSLINERLGITVDTLGLEPEEISARGRHHHFDLNDTQDRSRWRRDLGPYDVVVFAEVIEHLHTAPELVLAYLRTLMAGGGTLILQTPNAASLRKRLKLALGLNPFERIRLDPSNPGHFREYTLGELREIVSGAGFTVERHWTAYYFDARFARHDEGHEPPAQIAGALKNAANRLLPASLREGITILAVAGG